MDKALKLIFVQFSVLGGIVAGLVGQKIFELVRGVIDDEEAPDPKHRELPWKKLLPALVLEARSSAPFAPSSTTDRATPTAS